MINEVRNAVLAFLNKNNYGYITPQDFNLFAKQAQLDVFEDLFTQYNYQVNKENARQSGTGYADIKKGIEEDIDIFSQDALLTNALTMGATTNATNVWNLPSDYYFINRLYYRPQWVVFNYISSGVVTAYKLNIVVGATLPNGFAGVSVGDFVINYSSVPFTFAQVTAVDSATILTLNKDIFTVGVQTFSIWSNREVVEIERVHQNRVMQLLSSNLTAPSEEFPIYAVNGSDATVYPASISAPNPITLGVGSNNTIMMMCQYIRYPLDPKWTFTNITGGEPVFDQSQVDYQDFELPTDAFQDLIIRILQYAGVSIRELEVVKYGQGIEQITNQEEA